MGNFIVLVVLALVVALAIRYLYKKRKSSGGCSGNCSNCKGCH